MRASSIATALVALAFALAIPLAGCGSSGDSDTTAEAGAGTAPSSAGGLPEGTVATVADVPSGAAGPLEAPYENCEGKEVTPDVGEITKLEYTCAFDQAAAADKLKEPPHPGDPKYDKLRESAMTSLIEAAWLQAVATEEGVSVTKAQIANELAHLKEVNFPKKSEYEEFLTRVHYSPHDAEERVMLQLLTNRLRQRAKQRGKSGKLSEEEALTKFVAGYHRKWRGRTVCAHGFTTIFCSNVEAP